MKESDEDRIGAMLRSHCSTPWGQSLSDCYRLAVCLLVFGLLLSVPDELAAQMYPEQSRSDLEEAGLLGRVETLIQREYTVIETADGLKPGVPLGGSTRLRFDELGNRKATAYYSDDDSLETETLYAYDAQGRLIREDRWDRYGNPVGRTMYTLNAEGAVETVESYDAQGRPEIRTVYGYDHTGQLVSVYVQRGDGPTVLTLQHFRTAEGRLTATDRFGKDGSSAGRTVYHHDMAGNVETELHFAADGTLNRKLAYSYDPEGRLEAATEYTGTGQLVMQSRYSYSSAGTRTEFHSYGADGSVASSAHYLFAANGKMLEQVWHHADGSVDAISRYSYDVVGNLVEIARFSSVGELLGRYLSIYTYDYKGNWIRKVDADEIFTYGTAVMKPKLLSLRELTYYP